MLTSSNMRVYLSVPFAEKDKARRQGAFWDAVRGSWWINRHDIATHPGVHRWITDNAALAAKAKAAYEFIERKPPTAPKVKTRKPPVTTRASNFLLPNCEYETPPWECCENTATAGQA